MTRTEGTTSSRSQTTAAAMNEMSLPGLATEAGRHAPPALADLGMRAERVSPQSVPVSTSARRRPIKDRPARRELLALLTALALLVPAAPALAQANTATAPGTSGYKQTVPPPTTTPEPKKEVEHAKAEKKTTPTPTTTVEPTTTTPTAKASTLPFTGLDLRWVVGAGLLLLSTGLAIRLGQRTRAGR
jgi:hypothetical protein